MAYASWTVTAGETPTASKWNILGTNDASFNDGTGFQNGVIKSDQALGIKYYTKRVVGQSAPAGSWNTVLTQLITTDAPAVVICGVAGFVHRAGAGADTEVQGRILVNGSRIGPTAFRGRAGFNSDPYWEHFGQEIVAGAVAAGSHTITVQAYGAGAAVSVQELELTVLVFAQKAS